MAINPETQYPGKIAPSSPDYPYGSARNITLPGDGTGTPWEAALVNDIFGFQQALLNAAAIVPSGSPETVGVSQFLRALNKLYARVFDSAVELRAITSANIADGSSCFLTDNEVFGPFKLDRSDTTTPDDGGFVIVDASGGRWKRVTEAVRNVTKWSENSATSQVRHRYLAEKIRTASVSTIPQGFCIGNSIMQGSGSSGIAQTIPRRLAAKLQALYSIGTTNDWAPPNRGVGSSTTALGVAYVADNSDNPTNLPVSGVLTGGKDYCLILTLRNDVSVLSETRSAELIRAALQMLKNKNIEPIFITDPPKIDMGSGDILDDQANFGDWYDRALTACAAEGATVVDVWKYLVNLHTLGVDIRDFSSDGAHPNDAGHELIAELTFQAMIADSDRRRAAPVVRKAMDFADSVSVYDADGGTVTSTTTVSGLTTASTARKDETGEGTTEAFILNDGDTIEFDCPAPCQGFIVNMLGGASGNVDATYGAVNVGNFDAESSTVRERATLFRFSDGVVPYDFRNTLVLTSNGTSRVLGVTFLCERVSNDFQKWIDAAETGTWADGTFTAGGAVRESSTVSDFVEVQLYGSMVSLHYERGVNRGKFEWSVDGGAATEIDCYLNAADLKQRLVIDLGEEKWHTLRLEVTAKNPSSGSNLVKFGEFRRYLGVAAPDVDFMPQNAADVVDSRVKYELAEVVNSISGSPRAYDGLDGSSVTLNGSGSAVTRLTR